VKPGRRALIVLTSVVVGGRLAWNASCASAVVSELSAEP
jgi:hypothetical protein